MYGDEKKVLNETLSLREARIKVLEQKLKDASDQLISREQIYKSACEKMEQLENHVKMFKSTLDDYRQTISSGDSRLLSNDSDELFSRQSQLNSSTTPRSSTRELDLVARISLFQIEVENMMRNDRTNLQRIAKYQAAFHHLEANLTKAQKDSLAEF